MKSFYIKTLAWFLLFSILRSLSLFSETPAGTIIYNGGDSGILGIADQPGDTIVSRVLSSGSTLYYTCFPVGITVVAPSGILIINSVGKAVNIGDKIKISFDAFDVGQDVYLFYSTNPLTSPVLVNSALILEANSKVDSNPDIGYISDSILEIALQDVSGNWLSKTNFNSPVKIELYYSDTDNDGFVDGTYPPLYEDSLKIFVLNETLKQWDELKDSKLDTSSNFVEGSVNHFSVFVLIGKTSALNLDRVKVYPNPYKPGSGTKFDRPDGIVFDNLTQDVTLKIFNIAGELVYKYETNNSKGKHEWKAINNSGEKVASGVYVYFISNKNGDKRKGKIVIIR